MSVRAYVCVRVRVRRCVCVWSYERVTTGSYGSERVRVCLLCVRACVCMCVCVYLCLRVCTCVDIQAFRSMFAW